MPTSISKACKLTHLVGLIHAKKKRKNDNKPFCGGLVARQPVATASQDIMQHITPQKTVDKPIVVVFVRIEQMKEEQVGRFCYHWAEQGWLFPSVSILYARLS